MKRLLLLSFASIFIIVSLSGIALLAACTPVSFSHTGSTVTVSQETVTLPATQAPTQEIIEPTATIEGPKTIEETATPEVMLPSWIAYIGLDGNVQLLDANSGEQLAVTDDGSSAMDFPQPDHYFLYSDPAWSSDGTLLAYKRTENTKLSDRQDYMFSFMVYDLASGESRELVSDKELSGFAWRPGTHLIAYTLMTDPNYFTARAEVNADLAKGIMAIDAETGGTMELVKPQGYSLIQVQWSPDGQFASFYEIIYMEGKGNFAYYDFETQEYTSWGRAIGNHDWSPDDETLVYDDVTYVATGEEQIYLNDRYDEGETIFAEGDSSYYASNPLFSPDGETVLYKETDASSDNNISNLLVKELGGGKAESILEDTSIYDIRWSPDGEYALVVMGPYEHPTLLEVNVYDYTTRELGNGWTPVWQPLAQ